MKVWGYTNRECWAAGIWYSHEIRELHVSFLCFNVLIGKRWGDND